MNGRTASVTALPGVECFRAAGLKQRYCRHAHEGYAIGAFEDGVGGTDYRGARHYFPPGHVVAMNPGEAHTGFAADARGLTYRMFYVSETVFSAMAGGRAPCFGEVCIADARLASRLIRLHRLLERGAERLAGESEALRILGDFARRYGRGAPLPPAGREAPAVAQIKAFLRAHHARNVSIRELTAVTGLSAAYMIRAFHRAAGMPPHAWLLQFRIARARQMLAAGRPIAGVALDLGFADQSHLTRRFRSVTGLTPGQYAAGHYRSSRPS